MGNREVCLEYCTGIRSNRLLQLRVVMCGGAVINMAVKINEISTLLASLWLMGSIINVFVCLMNVRGSIMRHTRKEFLVKGNNT